MKFVIHFLKLKTGIYFGTQNNNQKT